MSTHGRRRVLTYAGLAMAGVYAAGAVTATDGTDGEAAGEHGDEGVSLLKEADGWSSVGGNPGNNAVVSSGGPEAPVRTVWEYDHGGPVAVVDGTVYLTSGGAVHALDAEDGSLQWQTDDIGAAGTPAVTSDAVFVGGERLTRVDVDDGSPCCEAELEYDAAVPSPVVADGLVFVAAGGRIYAVDADDGSEAWWFEPSDEPLFEQPVAVADKTVFAVSESRLFALKGRDGTERWTAEEPPVKQFDEGYFSDVHHPVATDDVVAVAVGERPNNTMYHQGTVALYDAETGERRVASGPPITPGPITDERFYAADTGARRTAAFDRETGAQVWSPMEVEYDVRSPIVGGDTVYMGVHVDGEGYKPGDEPDVMHGVFAFDEESGRKRWAVETDGQPDPPTLALEDGTLYASGDTLLALRSEETADEDEEAAEGADTADADGDASTTDADEATAERNGGADANETGNESDDALEAERTENASTDIETAEDGGGSGETTAEADANEGGGDDGTPGFTAVTGLGGGALALEWLRRRAVDDAERSTAE